MLQQVAHWARTALARAQLPQGHVSLEQPQVHAERAAQTASRRQMPAPLALQ